MTIGRHESLDRRLASYGSIALRRKLATPDDDAREDDNAHWKRFAAAAGISLAAANADAAINHVVPPSPIRVNASAGYGVGIDLDNDSIFDVQLGAAHFGNAYSGAFRGTLKGLNGAAVQVGSYFFSGPYTNFGVLRYGFGASITPAFGGYASILRQSLTYFGSAYPTYGQWGLNDVAYAGFIDTVVGTPRAGWIKVRTESSGGHLGAVEVLEWAYQTVPGALITAGQTSAGGIPGDYNNNGSVGPEDYDVWKNTFGQNVTAGEGADGNSSSKVDAADYTVWRNNLGASGSGSLSGAVPEPSTVTLGVLALGAAGVASLRRRSK